MLGAGGHSKFISALGDDDIWEVPSQVVGLQERLLRAPVQD